MNNQLSYPIIIGENAIKVLPEFLSKRKSKKVYLISDVRLTAARKKILQLLIKKGLTVHEIPVKAGEKLKDIRSVYPIYGELLDKKADRDSIILALGGGTVGDVAGFIASTYLRGIDWVSIPSTLLAQVDSGTGGKTGINHSTGKNLIGTFHQPSLVICDTSLLRTLGKREMISGFGEIVKYAIAFDPTFFKYLETNLTLLLKFDRKVIQHCVERSLYWKCKLVEEDIFDRTGIREKLNFGHTFAHALETATQYKTYQHGEAVILGMRFAIRLSVQRGKLSSASMLKIDSLLSKLLVPKIPGKIKSAKIFELMKKDKKVEGDRVRFVLLERIGKTVSDSHVTLADLKEAYPW